MAVSIRRYRATTAIYVRQTAAITSLDAITTQSRAMMEICAPPILAILSLDVHHLQYRATIKMHARSTHAIPLQVVTILLFRAMT